MLLRLVKNDEAEVALMSKKNNFNGVSKEIRDCFVLALVRPMIGPENSHHSLNQSDAKLKRLGRPRFPAL